MKRRSFLGLVTGAVAGGRQATTTVLQSAGIKVAGTGVASVVSESMSGIEAETDATVLTTAREKIAKALLLRKVGMPKAVVEKVTAKARLVEAIDVDIGVLRSTSASHKVLAQRKRQIARAIDVDERVREIIREVAISEAQEKTGIQFWFW
jgi:hypothetical protein